MSIGSDIRHYFRVCLTNSPKVVSIKAASIVRRQISGKLGRVLDLAFPSYVKAPAAGNFYRFFDLPPVEKLQEIAHWLLPVTKRYLEHRFDLLGSGWVQVRHGVACNGLGEYRYPPAKVVCPDREGNWLGGRINAANLTESRRLWALVDSGYCPIDWQLDFKSGYRWSEKSWYRKIRHGHLPGVDVKVPWELGRLQHLPQLALAHALASSGAEGFSPTEVYAAEFRNQVLDFIATNPPRFGVNWACTMDVAIRAVNLLVAYDLFLADDAEFDKEFTAVFGRSILEHGRHIAGNLEWSEKLCSNHYLANVAGLLYVAAYLPRADYSDAWLAFSLQELVSEVASQFQSDGSNFEASTCYHRLSAEMVLYTTALVLGLPAERRTALLKYDHRLIKGRPSLAPAPVPHFSCVDLELEVPFADWYFERLVRMAEFTLHVSHADGHVAQIGDNDSGRFLKLTPVFREMMVATAKSRYLNLQNYQGLADEDEHWQEDMLDHSHLVAIAGALFDQEDLNVLSSGSGLEARLVRTLAGGLRLPCCRKLPEPIAEERVRCFSYPDFGLYVYRSDRIILLVRCGTVGQHGFGGHAHNDALSFELTINGVPLVVDPGTGVYTPDVTMRNRFRSVAAHNTLALLNQEPNPWADGQRGLFRLVDRASARAIVVKPDRFCGEHWGYGVVHRREILIEKNGVEGKDECAAIGERQVSFHLPPGLCATLLPERNGAEIRQGGVSIVFSGGPGEWGVEKTLFSPAYGVIEESEVLLLRSCSPQLFWKIQEVGSE